MSDEVNDVDFVKIRISKKQVLSKVVHNDHNNKDYRVIIAPGNSTFLYPATGLKQDKYDEGKLFFTRPKGTEIILKYSVRKEGVDNNAPISEQYESYNKTIKIEDLKELYDNAKKEYIQGNSNDIFIHITVPESLVKYYDGKDDNTGKKFAEITVPLEENNKKEYYKFSIPAEYIKESFNIPGVKVFDLYKSKLDGQPYEVSMSKDIRENDDWKKINKIFTSEQVKETLSQLIADNKRIISRHKQIH